MVCKVIPRESSDEKKGYRVATKSTQTLMVLAQPNSRLERFLGGQRKH